MDEPALRLLSRAAETAVLVLVPEAETAVGRHRRGLDVAASWGVPAHVSVVYPFAPPSAVDDEVVALLATAVAGVPAFGCTFSRTAWFGDEVLWLAPEPDQGFRELTRSVQAAFPAYLPYGGVHGEPVPHLTVAESRLGDVPTLRAAENALIGELPIPATVTTAALLAGRPAAGSWSVVHEFRLGLPDA